MKPGYAALCLTLAAACGTLRPASSSEPVSSPPSQVQLEAVEGVPSGLALRLKTALAGTSAELYRVAEGGEPERLTSVDITPAIADSLREGLDIVDSTIVPGEWSYQLYLVAEDEVAAQSAVIDVTWRQPPPRVGEVLAATHFPDAVELSWRADETLGAVVFRRDVLDQSSEFERVASVPAGAGRWVDRAVGPGQVWSYRVALSFEHPSGLVQYGSASEEVYASTPEPQ